MTHTHTCIECAVEFTPKKSSAHFCGTPCRKAFNNRRMTRGAIIYDLFCAMRYDRSWAKTVGLWQLMCRLLSEWREEDQERNRQTFVRPQGWVNENAAWLRSKVFKVAIGRGARK